MPIVTNHNCFPLTEMSANPIDNGGIEPGAFEGVTVYHIRIAEAKLTSVPKGMVTFISKTIALIDLAITCCYLHILVL